MSARVVVRSVSTDRFLQYVAPILIGVMFLLSLSGCATATSPAPVAEKGPTYAKGPAYASTPAVATPSRRAEYMYSNPATPTRVATVQSPQGVALCWENVPEPVFFVLDTGSKRKTGAEGDLRPANQTVTNGCAFVLLGNGGFQLYGRPNADGSRRPLFTTASPEQDRVVRGQNVCTRSDSGGSLYVSTLVPGGAALCGVHGVYQGPGMAPVPGATIAVAVANPATAPQAALQTPVVAPAPPAAAASALPACPKERPIRQINEKTGENKCVAEQKVPHKKPADPAPVAGSSCKQGNPPILAADGKTLIQCFNGIWGTVPDVQVPPAAAPSAKSAETPKK